MKKTLNDYIAALTKAYQKYMTDICDAQKEGHLSDDQPYWEWLYWVNDPDIDLPTGIVTLDNSSAIIQQLQNGAYELPADLLPLVVARIMVETWVLRQSEIVKNTK